jgi:hypothetical protein
MPLTCRYVLRGGIRGRRRPLCVRALGAVGRVTHGRARTASVWYLTCWFAEYRRYPGCLFFNLTRAVRGSGGIWSTAPEDAPQVYSVVEAEHTDDFSGGTVCRWSGTYGGGQDEPDVLAAAV